MKENMCSRKSLWTIFALLVVLALLSSGCGAKPRTYRVGILSGLEVFATVVEGFKAGMTELGYVEGENITYDFREVYTGDPDMQAVLDEFVADEVDLIFAYPTEPALLAKAATQGTDIPVVFAMGTVEGSNLVESIREPGGNVTGVRYSGPDLFVKYLEFLLQMSPDIQRAWLTYDPDYPAIPSTLEALRPAAASAGVTLVEVPVKSPDEIQADLAARDQLADPGVDCIVMVPGISHAPPSWAAISAFAAAHRIPIGGGLPAAVDAGETVFTYMPDNFEVGELAASLADKIFRGTPAGTIPVVTQEPRLRLNLALAQGLGLTVPEDLLGLATEVVR